MLARTEKVARRVYKAYADVLIGFNLHVNTAKSVSMTRPFVTNKSRLIQAASNEANKFVDKFLETTNDTAVLLPKTIRSRWRLTKSFIEAIKALCSYNQVNYDEIAAYLIAVLTERVKKLVAIEIINDPITAEHRYRDVILVLLDVLYFLYGVSPSVGASYKLCTSVILIIRFTKKHLPELEGTAAHAIYELTQMLLSEHESSNPDDIDGFLPLEVLNIILASRELDYNYLLPESTVTALFSDESNHSYFSIVSCLFYIRDESAYENLRKSMLGVADKKLADLSDLRMNSEKTYLLLDLLTCPYVRDKRKIVWVKRAFVALGLARPTKLEISTFLLSTQTVHVHINWRDVDLLNSLEKKELKQAY